MFQSLLRTNVSILQLPRVYSIHIHTYNGLVGYWKRWKNKIERAASLYVIIIIAKCFSINAVEVTNALRSKKCLSKYMLSVSINYLFFVVMMDYYHLISYLPLYQANKNMITNTS